MTLFLVEIDGVRHLVDPAGYERGIMALCGAGVDVGTTLHRATWHPIEVDCDECAALRPR